MSKTLMNKLFTKQRLCSLKIEKGFDLQQHVNVFNNIIIDLVRIKVLIDNKDKEIILLCSLLDSYDYLVTTLTYEKDTIILDVIIVTLLSQSQRRQSVKEDCTLEEGLSKQKLWLIKFCKYGSNQ